jgi:hypothetical protein
VPNWIQQKALPALLYDVRSVVWFNLGYAALALAVIGLLVRHLRVRLAIVPESPLGRAQLLFVVFLWWIVVGNLMHAIPPFAEQRLITEGVIQIVAVLCTVLALLWSCPACLPDWQEGDSSGRSLLGLGGIGVAVLLAAVAGASYATWAMYGNALVGQAGYHTRFGPDARTGKPEPGKPHP